MRINIIEHKGKKIIYADHKGLTGQDMIDNMRELNNQVIVNKYELLLADFRDSSISSDVVEYLKGSETKEATTFYKKQAIIGITGIKKAIANMYNTITKSNIKLFDTIEQAKEYLVED